MTDRLTLVLGETPAAFSLCPNDALAVLARGLQAARLMPTSVKPVIRQKAIAARTELIGRSIRWVSCVMTRMCRLRHYFKIVQPVIAAIAVLVVDNLALKQCAPEVSFHNESMLEHAAPVHDNPTIAIVQRAATPRRAAAIRRERISIAFPDVVVPPAKALCSVLFIATRYGALSVALRGHGFYFNSQLRLKETDD